MNSRNRGSGPLNPLARRVAGADEPETVDLLQDGGFQEASDNAPEVPATGEAVAGAEAVLRYDPGTAALLLCCGAEGVEIRLNGDPLSGDATLAPGDVVDIGQRSIRLLR